MRIEFLENKGFCKKGSVHIFPEKDGAELVSRGIAKEVDEEKPVRNNKKKKTFKGSK